MGLETHIARRGSRYYFRLRLPKDIAGYLGKTELKRGLGTSDPAQAKIRASLLRHRAYQGFKTIRECAMVEPEKIAQIARAFYEQCLDQDGEVRARSKSGSHAQRLHERLKHNRAEALGTFKAAIADGDHSAVQPYLDSAITEEKLDVPPDSPDYYQLGQALMQALIEANERMLARDGGDFHDMPSDPLIRVGALISGGKTGIRHPAMLPERSGLSADSQKPVSALLERFLQEKKDLEAKTKNDYEASLGLLNRFLKSKPVGEIGKNDIVGFKDMLLKLPKNFKIVFKTEDASLAIRQNEKAQKPTLHAYTINAKYLSNIKTFFDWAVANNLTADNPATKITVKSGSKTRASDQRLPFSQSQLQTLFTSPLFMGCLSKATVEKPGRYLVADHRYWAPLIGLFSGARLNEIGQLEVADIIQLNGIHHFNITTESDDPKANKKLKTSAARRQIPLHPILEELGFLDYVAAIREQGQKRLFPEWKLGLDGRYSTPMSKWFSRLLKKLGLKSNKHSFHSLRHSYKDALRQAGIPEIAQDYVMGHANQTVQERYGSTGLLPNEAAALRAIKFGQLNLSHPYRKWSG